MRRRQSGWACGRLVRAREGAARQAHPGPTPAPPPFSPTSRAAASKAGLRSPQPTLPHILCHPTRPPLPPAKRRTTPRPPPAASSLPPPPRPSSLPPPSPPPPLSLSLCLSRPLNGPLPRPLPSAGRPVPSTAGVVCPVLTLRCNTPPPCPPLSPSLSARRRRRQRQASLRRDKHNSQCLFFHPSLQCSRLVRHPLCSAICRRPRPAIKTPTPTARLAHQHGGCTRQARAAVD